MGAPVEHDLIVSKIHLSDYGHGCICPVAFHLIQPGINEMA
jgi:hypothetical protein